MSIKALHSNAVVKIIELPNISSGGIVLTSTDISCTGKVLSVGPGKVLKDGTREVMGIAVGDEVIFGTNALTNVVEGTEDTFIMGIELIYGKKQ